MPDEEPEVHAPGVEHLAHGFRVSAEQAEPYQRVRLLELCDHICDKRHRGRFPAAYAHLPGEGAGRDAELVLGSADEVDDLLGALAQAKARLGELDATAPALEQLDSQLALEVLHLPRERRLRYMQDLRSAGYGSLARDHEEVLQVAELHEVRPPLPFDGFGTVSLLDWAHRVNSDAT